VKFIGLTSMAAILFLFGTMMSVSAQHDGGGKQEEKQAAPQEHAQQPQRAQQPAPQEQQRAAQPAQQQRPAQPAPQQQQRAAQPKPQEQQRDAQPAQQQRPAQPAPQQQQQQRAAQPKPQEQQRAQQSQQTQQARQQPQPQRTQQQARSWQQQKGWAQQGGGSQGHATFAQDRSQNWSSDHRTWSQRGGYGGYYIPQDRFSVSFGSQHFFRLGVLPVMYLGYPQFSYGGFSFLLVDPWPSDWPGNWYSDDDVYIDYDDGYYLYNRHYPQERLAITIEL